MGLFTPHKKHARQFNYTPRYYDPAKEEYDERRAELHGEVPEHMERELRPGDRIRMKREVRRRRIAEQDRQSRKSKYLKLLLLLGGVVALWWLITSFVATIEPKVQDDTYNQEPLSDAEQQQVVDGVVFDGGQQYEITDNDGNPLSAEEVEKMFDEKMRLLEELEKK